MWNYTREESKQEQESKQQQEVLPEGDYRIKIKSARKTVSKAGNEMLALQFNVSGSNAIVYHYIAFLKDRPEITNRSLTQFFDSFAGIKDGDFNMSNWVGELGACRICHDEYMGKPTLKVYYFIPADRQDEMPPYEEYTVKPMWEEYDVKRTIDPSTGLSLIDIADDDLPF